MHEAKQTHSEEQTANLTKDLDKIKNIEQLFEQLPCINGMCQNLKSKLQSKSAVCIVHAQNREGNHLVCVLPFHINSGVIYFEKYAMFSIHQNEWNDSTHLLCKMTKECYPVFGLFWSFIRTMTNKICPREIPHWYMFMKITSISYYWVLVEKLYLEDIYMIYDSQVNWKTYEKLPESTLEQLRFVDCPQQPNHDFSCGLHALMFLIFKKHRKPITPNCLKIDDQYSILDDLCCLLNGDNKITTETLTRKYYKHEYGRNETWNTYKEIKEICTSTLMSKGTGPLQMLGDE